jgi:hypothetical protein
LLLLQSWNFFDYVVTIVVSNGTYTFEK